MRLIDVLVKQANKEIEDGTILKIPDEELFGKKSVFEFEFYEDHFYGEEGLTVEDLYPFDTDFLNSEVELIQPKEKKYLVKVNVQWLDKDFAYLNYDKQKNCVMIYNKVENITYKTHFTKQELQSIKPVRESLKDMEGKYELIEVEDSIDSIKCNSANIATNEKRTLTFLNGTTSKDSENNEND